MTERRYETAEVAEIFRVATEEQQGSRLPLTRDGMTLGQLQEIGREVGIPPEQIARAAAALERTGVAATRRFLGLPLGVSRTVQLPRRLTDAEWEALVVDLRDTFDARGRLRDDGAFKQWTNGNLQALLEPVGEGHRLKLRTMNGAARAWLTAGFALLGVAAAIGVSALVGHLPFSEFISKIGMTAAMGAGMIAVGALRLPGWARTRRQQMEAIASRTAP